MCLVEVTPLPTGVATPLRLASNGPVATPSAPFITGFNLGETLRPSRSLNLVFFSAFAHPLEAELNRFASIPDPEFYPRGVEISRRYEVLVKTVDDATPWDTALHRTATYRLWPDYLDPETLPAKHSQTAVHIAQVDTDVRLRVRVQIIDGGNINQLRLKPTRITEMLVTQESDHDSVEFEIDPAAHTRSVLVEINPPAHDADALQDGFLFFANPISEIPPGNLLVLPSGVINENSPYLDELNRLLITEDSAYDALYIPSDTLIDGRVDIRKAGFTVAGRGMIIGSRWPFVKAVPKWRLSYPTWISPDGEEMKPLLSFKTPGSARDTSSHFEGVLVAHPYHFCVGWAYQNDNLKTFGWRFSSDGIHGVHKRGSFMRVNDDATYINEGSVEDCTYWGMVNGACLQLGWGLTRDNDTPVHVRRIDVVRGEWDNAVNPGVDGLGAPVELPTKKNASSNRGVFVGTFRSGQAFTIRNKFFEDVRVDAQVNRLFYFGSRTEEVSYENFVFKDIWFAQRPNYLEGVQNVLEGKVTVGGFIFENFTIGDQQIESLDGFAPLKQRNLRDVTFR